MIARIARFSERRCVLATALIQLRFALVAQQVHDGV
jgi:hypothetical protein